MLLLIPVTRRNLRCTIHCITKLFLRGVCRVRVRVCSDSCRALAGHYDGKVKKRHLTRGGRHGGTASNKIEGSEKKGTLRNVLLLGGVMNGAKKRPNGDIKE